jgi:hypothetical protein
MAKAAFPPIPTEACFAERLPLDRTSLEIAIFISGFLILRGIFVLLRGGANPRRDTSAEENIRPTEEVVFLLSVILLAISLALFFSRP